MSNIDGGIWGKIMRITLYTEDGNTVLRDFILSIY